MTKFKSIVDKKSASVQKVAKKRPLKPRKVKNVDIKNPVKAQRAFDQSEKLQKILARAGQGSRRELEKVISEGRVSVDGKVATLGDRFIINAQTKIRIDGNVVDLRASEKNICRVLAYYKPEGEVTTTNDPENRATVFDRLPRIKGARWIAIGRLDINTSGLLLFTTDGELANRLMHPSKEVEREYAVRVFGEIDDKMIAKLRKGVMLEDGMASFKSIKSAGGTGINQWFDVMLTEGRNREVRRLWESQNVQVSRLIRTRYGNIKLEKDLPRGGFKELELQEVNYLRELVGLTPETETKLVVPAQRRRTKIHQIRKAVRNHQKYRKSNK